MYKWNVLLAIIPGLMFSGCLTPAQKQKPGEVTGGPKRPKPVAIYEEDTTTTTAQAPKDTSMAKALLAADTTAAPKPDTVYAAKLSADTGKAGALPAPKGTRSAAPLKTIPGFRVQVFASTSKVNAERVLGEVRALLGEKTYLEVIPPLYKVRVGNCLTQQEALPLKDRAIEKGYKSAFVVETDIEL